METPAGQEQRGDGLHGSACHPRHHRSHILNDARLQRIDERSSHTACRLHDECFVDEETLITVRHDEPPIAEWSDPRLMPDVGCQSCKEEPTTLEYTPHF